MLGARRTGNGQNSDGRRGVRGSEKPGSAKDQTDPFLAFVARLMDTAFTIPGTNIRFGLDPVIGLIPGIGDCVATLISTLLILQSARYRLPKIVLTRMALNVLLLGICFCVRRTGNGQNGDGRRGVRGSDVSGTDGQRNSHATCQVSAAR